MEMDLECQGVRAPESIKVRLPRTDAHKSGQRAFIKAREDHFSSTPAAARLTTGPENLEATVGEPTSRSRGSQRRGRAFRGETPPLPCSSLIGGGVHLASSSLSSVHVSFPDFFVGVAGKPACCEDYWRSEENTLLTGPRHTISTQKNVEDFTGPRERSDLGFITFDITADLENIFDWNVKQLFLYLSAEYSTKNNALNQVVLWDKIVLRGDNPKLLLKDMKTKYFFFDDGNGLKGNRNVTLTLSWNVVPNAGILPLVTGSGHVSVPFPDTYEITKSY
ncbi:signal peptidase complex subunit 3 [Suricata suricatta]|uniref:signal peptidase complex subunit 3 n=1 Tax=Suricata suricatta TaxID=37032 RepID=UPI0011555A6A|nr:signal peptidase complex subunit 3 [Suricata suricatta]